ncbi:MAG: ATP-dependent zinc metalloprotease FtsH [Candidatus Pacebacteria bacterium]|nr:ATP-dependent zinc metalloprotease FtsH [Candidatus Paceibacterota bacterium]
MKEYLGKNIVIVVATFILLALVFGFATIGQEKPEEISLSKLAEKINQEEIKEIIAVGSVLQITDKEGAEFTTRKESESSLSDSLASYGVETEKLTSINVNIKEPQDWSLLNFAIIALIPLIFFLIFFWYIFKQAKGGAMQSLEFTKSKAKLLGIGDTDDKEKTKFGDVAGLKEVKEELQEIVDFLKNPKKFHDMGAKIPKGVLLIGPAGVGKTLLARAIAGEAGVNFFHTSGSTFVELFVGTGAARIRDLFNTAKKSAPAIIFIDELDAVGRMRGSGIGGGHDEKEQTLNQLLVEMDGFEKNSNVIVVSATNRPDVLDSALLRPGRFDRLITLDNPDIKDREDILKIHTKNKPLAEDVDLREVAERTPGFSGADLANVANEGAILAARKNKKKIYQENFLESIEKVLLGPQRKSHILSKKEKEISAVHEVGHALTSAFLEKSSPVRKISIISRGSAAGYTITLPKEEKRIKTKSEFLAEISSLLGGYCAEKIKYGEMSSGASNDIKRASAIANRVVREYGMSSLGPISFSKNSDNVFLGKDLTERNNYSEKIASKIDEEVAIIIKKAEEKTNKILSQNKDLLDTITKVLIEKETIEKEEFDKLFKRGA